LDEEAGSFPVVQFNPVKNLMKKEDVWMFDVAKMI
jgi:hypothetical protein